jgi:hypothetical protein
MNDEKRKQSTIRFWLGVVKQTKKSEKNKRKTTTKQK